MSSSPTIETVPSKQESDTRTIHADELRSGYEVVCGHGLERRIVSRVRCLPFAHLVMVLYEGDHVYHPYARSHELEVTLSDVDF